MEIGAFQAERGVLQRVRFNVALEVAARDSGTDDHVDRILSYDWICESIDHVIGLGRVDLLETFAESLAERLLADPRAEHATVSIEKLDRVPGALGVEIRRSRRELASSVLPGAAARGSDPLVLLLPDCEIESVRLESWLDAIHARPNPCIICVEAQSRDFPVTGEDDIDRRIRILAIEQNAWRLSALDDRCSVVDSRAELEHALQEGGTAIWAPTRRMLDYTGWPEERLGLALDLAVGLARKLSAPQVVRCGGEPGIGADPSVRAVAGPEEL